MTRETETKPHAHTPGQWELVLEKCWGWCVKVGKDYIAFRVRKKEDASLISAAPELLQVCEDELEALRIWLSAEFAAKKENADITDGMFISIEKIKAAIAKAVQS